MRPHTIRSAGELDADRIAQIYNHYVIHTTVTFEEDAVSGGEMVARIQAVRAASLPWIVAEMESGLAGYACASRWKDRCAYRFSAETSVYVTPDAFGCGLGESLMRSLIRELMDSGWHALIAGIALPNEASIRLHEKIGFRKVAHFPQVGRKFGAWIDVAYWQLLLPDGADRRLV